MAHHDARQAGHNRSGCGEQKKDGDDAGKAAHRKLCYQYKSGSRSASLAAGTFGERRCTSGFAPNDEVAHQERGFETGFNVGIVRR
jgi:hypothetical protein